MTYEEYFETQFQNEADLIEKKANARLMHEKF